MDSEMNFWVMACHVQAVLFCTTMEPQLRMVNLQTFRLMNMHGMDSTGHMSS